MTATCGGAARWRGSRARRSDLPRRRDAAVKRLGERDARTPKIRDAAPARGSPSCRRSSSSSSRAGRSRRSRRRSRRASSRRCSPRRSSRRRRRSRPSARPRAACLRSGGSRSNGVRVVSQRLVRAARRELAAAGRPTSRRPKNRLEKQKDAARRTADLGRRVEEGRDDVGAAGVVGELARALRRRREGLAGDGDLVARARRVRRAHGPGRRDGLAHADVLREVVGPVLEVLVLVVRACARRRRAALPGTAGAAPALQRKWLSLAEK